MSNEERIKVFALYLGCEVQTLDGTFKDTLLGLGRDGSCFVAGGYLHASDCQLILKPLSEITDEDAIEVCKLHTDRHSGIEVLETSERGIHFIDGSWWHGDGVSEMNDLYVSFKSDMDYATADFLRFKRYHVPYLGQDLFEQGVAIKQPHD